MFRLVRKSHPLVSTALLQAIRVASATATPGKVTVKVRDADGHVQASSYACGINLMNAIRDDPTTMADMQGSCDGKLECSTCHVYVEGKWAEAVEKLIPCSDREMDVLDKALEAKDNSRLACQIVLSPELDGLEVSMPASARDARFDQFVDRALKGQSQK